MTLPEPDPNILLDDETGEPLLRPDTVEPLVGDEPMMTDRPIDEEDLEA